MLYRIVHVHFFFLFFSFFFFFLFFPHDFVRAISLEPLLAENPNLVCYLVLRSNCALLHTIQFVLLLFIFFFFFSAKILSGPYLWNRYLQRLLTECAAWSCGLILNCCLPSNSLHYYYYFISFLFLRHNFVGPYLWNRYSQRLQIECAGWSCGLILHCCLPSNSLRYFFFFPPRFFFATIFFSATISFFCYNFFFPPRFCPGHSLR